MRTPLAAFTLLGLTAVAHAGSRTPAATPLPAPVTVALERALAVPGARLVPVDLRSSLPPGCEAQGASVPRSITGSGRYAVKIAGQRCSGWAWVQLEVWAPVAITARAVRAGERLAEAITTAEREILPGRAAYAPPVDATAARALPRGRAVAAEDVAGAAGLAAGAPVKVIVRAGAVVLEQTGRAIPCGAGRTCAVLPTGKHVEGRREPIGLVVEVP